MKRYHVVHVSYWVVEDDSTGDWLEEEFDNKYAAEEFAEELEKELEE